MSVALPDGLRKTVIGLQCATGLAASVQVEGVCEESVRGKNAVVKKNKKTFLRERRGKIVAQILVESVVVIVKNVHGRVHCWSGCAMLSGRRQSVNSELFLGFQNVCVFKDMNYWNKTNILSYFLLTITVSPKLPPHLS